MGPVQTILVETTAIRFSDACEPSGSLKNQIRGKVPARIPEAWQHESRLLPYKVSSQSRSVLIASRVAQ
jgi:hypothetical protein